MKPDPTSSPKAKFLGLYYEWFLKQPHYTDGIHPLNFLKKLQLSDPSKVALALRIGVKDCVDAADTWALEVVDEVDTRLDEAGAMTLSMARIAHGGRIARLLRSGEITSEEDLRYATHTLHGRGVAPDSKRTQKLQGLVAQSRRPAGSKEAPG